MNGLLQASDAARQAFIGEPGFVDRVNEEVSVPIVFTPRTKTIRIIWVEGILKASIIQIFYWNEAGEIPCTCYATGLFLKFFRLAIACFSKNDCPTCLQNCFPIGLS
ncbi:hypothetical protein CH339_23065 [Rhodobium orientis]|uniref:Uncharacterized protein n=1 Tax=Rhodobium orientis TaxID=34017 RepID=A0A327JDX5_9HYPH|nr:hypothetical protein [Rhodobium orientis]RAI23854.1 hypothetical protein CH339_23065 [Rhodobium orientis]